MTEQLALIDVETTGLDPATCRVVEVAVRVIEPRPGGDSRTLESLDVTIDADVDVPPGAAAVHGLTRGLLARTGAPPATVWAQVAKMLVGRTMVAHNAPFDRDFVASELYRLGADRDAEYVSDPDRWLDTLNLSRHLLPDLEAHGLPALYYAMFPDPPTRPTFHRAGEDVQILQRVLDQLLGAYALKNPGGVDGDVIGGLLELAQTPAIGFRMPTGKHKGMALSRLPTDYLRWVERSGAFPGSLRDSLLAVLAHRREA